MLQFNMPTLADGGGGAGTWAIADATKPVVTRKAAKTRRDFDMQFSPSHGESAHLPIRPGLHHHDDRGHLTPSILKAVPPSARWPNRPPAFAATRQPQLRWSETAGLDAISQCSTGKHIPKHNT